MFHLLKRRKGNRPKKLGLKYVDKDSIFHRFDPRTKLFLLILFSLVVFLLGTLPEIVALFALIVILTVWAQIVREWLRSMAKLLPFLIVLVLFSCFFSKVQWGNVYYASTFWVHLQISDGSIVNAMTIGFRFLSLTGISLLFLMTTKYEDFVKGLRKLKVPFTFAFSLGLALRSITYLTADVKNILDAQRSRGLEIDRKDLLRNYVKFLSLFVPIIICLLTRSKNISEATQVRAFGQARRPTMYREVRMRGIDYGFMLMSGVAALLLVLL